jgi:hypothetical protein
MKLQLGKIIGWTVSILVIALAAFIYIRFYIIRYFIHRSGTCPVTLTYSF